ncbi:MAG TPA: hypothetical protein PKK03_08310 [Bacteroidales bacterium]|jgi:hypothetical protein|nr:hypothetical protein [Bacteroidales bacterium]HPS98015.1 hypothetical protein [Bacteroidales bacterium]
MIKRITVILIFMLAGILLVAHAVVPHHHHDKQVCFEKSHCIHEDSDEEPGTSHDGHSHDGENNHNDCALNDPVVITTNEWKPDFKLIQASDRTGFDGLHVSLLNNSSGCLTPSLSSCVYERVTDSLFPSAVPDSHGLRAPPAA